LSIEKEYEKHRLDQMSIMKTPNVEFAHSYRCFLRQKGYPKDKINDLYNKRMGRLISEAQAEPMPPMELKDMCGKC